MVKLVAVENGEPWGDTVVTFQLLSADKSKLVTPGRRDERLVVAHLFFKEGNKTKSGPHQQL